MDVNLIAVHKDGGTRNIPLRSDRHVVGRQRSCSLRIPVASVSREHCEIVAGAGGVMVRDLGSSNGTYVNQKRVQETELVAGDLIAVGPVVLLVQVAGEPGDLDAASCYQRGMPAVAETAQVSAAAPAARPASPDSVTKIGVAEDDLLAGIDIGGGPGADESSEFDFDFDLSDDDDDDQPAL